MNDNFNSIVDRALGENQGSCLMNKKADGKYSIFLPLENLGAIGSAPEQIEKTAIGNMAKSYIQGRKDSPQQSLSFYVHRDNLKILEAVKGTVQDFMRVFPDFSAIKYSGQVDYSVDDTALTAAEQGKVTITVTIPESVVEDCYDLIEDTAIFTTDIPSVLNVKGTGIATINVTTNPADATITATSGTTSVATASYADSKVTVTGVTAGTSIITIKASKTGFASWERSVLVIDKAA